MPRKTIKYDLATYLNTIIGDTFFSSYQVTVTMDSKAFNAIELVRMMVDNGANITIKEPMRAGLSFGANPIGNMSEIDLADALGLDHEITYTIRYGTSDDFEKRTKGRTVVGNLRNQPSHEPSFSTSSIDLLQYCKSTNIRAVGAIFPCIVVSNPENEESVQRLIYSDPNIMTSAPNASPSTQPSGEISLKISALSIVKLLEMKNWPMVVGGSLVSSK